MPSNLTSQYIKFTYRQLLHVSDGVTASLKTVYSGLGVATALKVSVGSVAVDNLKFDGNVISSTDTDGDIILTPNGTGKVNIGAINITGGVITGITDLAIADGGTGASTAAGARDNLGLEIGVDIMPFYVSQTYGRSLWNAASAAAARALLGINESGSTALLVANNLSDLADVPTAQINLQLEPGVDVQVWNANLDDWATKLSSDYATTSYVTSAISTAGGAYQPLDADLTAIAAAGSTAAGITILQFTDPNADRIMFWDDSAGAFAGLTLPAAGLSITTTALSLANDLAALEGLSSTGFAVRSAPDTWVQRQLAAPAAGFTITNPAGIAGDPTFVLANDLAAYEGLATTGVVIRTGDGTATTRAITGTANEITVANGNGVSANPTFSLPSALTFTGKTVTGGTFSGITLSGTIAGSVTYSGSSTYSGANVFSGNTYPIRMSDGGYFRWYNGSTGVDWAMGKPDADQLILYRNGTPRLQFDSSGNVFFSSNVTFTGSVNKFSSQAPQSSTTLANRGAYNSFEWGHSNTSGYGSVIGAEAGSGAPFLAFNGEHGTNSSTYLTRGIKAAIFKSDNAGGFYWGTVASASADNQAFSARMALDVNGALTVGDASTVANMRVNGTASGSGGGAYMAVQNNSSIITALGNISAILGGAYGSDTLWFNTNGIQCRAGGSNIWLSVTSAGAATFPLGSLNIGASSNPRLSVYNNAGTASTLTIGADSAAGFIGMFTAASLSVYTNSTQRAYWTSSGLMYQLANFYWGPSQQGTLTYSGSDAYIDAAGDMNLRAGGGTTFAIGRTTGLQAKTAAGTTTTGTLVVADANTRVTLTGGITLPNSVFAAGDMHVWHAGTSARTITRGSGVTMYVNGTNVASATLAANSIGGAYWSDASTVHLTGAIS